MRKLIYHCAIAVDGFVAGEGGSIDFFEMQGPHVDDFIAGFSGFDDAIMGRKTYEVGLNVGRKFSDGLRFKGALLQSW